jgi:hypothetical protein
MIVQPLSTIVTAAGSPNANTVGNATLVYCVHSENSPSQKRFIHIVDPNGSTAPHTPMGVSSSSPVRQLVARIQIGKNVPIVLKKNSTHEIYSSTGVLGGGAGGAAQTTGVTFTKVGYAS